MELTRNMEDYLEAIYALSRDNDVRVKDIADRLGIKSASVSEMLRKLDKCRYVAYERYGKIELTSNGELIGKTVMVRHETIKAFLRIILVPVDAAEKSACTIEHNLEPETVEQLTKFVKFVGAYDMHPKWLEHFEAYCESGKIPKCDYSR
ncbi:MAG: metal-dependent transcriptional regulator [archaeon]|nr:metal-dependent transcriptional regulator [archaeon]